MNRKGFTFIELLAVLVLIGVVLLIAIPSIRYADRKFHEKAYKTKLDMILTAAKEFGDDNKEIIVYQTNGSVYTDPATGTDYPSVVVYVRDLLNNGYISKDSNVKKTDILDPRDDSSMLDKRITIYIKNDRAYAILNQ